MELRHLRYFVAVAEDLNFRKAAGRLHISRPALSKQIKDLEDEMSVKLLKRDTVSVALTNAGKVFLEDARLVLEQSDNAVVRAREAHAGNLGSLRIGSVGVIATEFLPATLKIFQQTYPEVEVSFVEMLPAEQLDALAAGRIDIGFAYGPNAGNIPGQHSLCVIQSTFGVAVSKLNSCTKCSEVTLQKLVGKTILCLGKEPKSIHREDILRFFSQEGLRPSKTRTVEGFDSLVTLIAADQGISLLPEVLDLENQGVKIIPLLSTHTDFDFRMWAVWQADNPSRLVQHFVQLLEERNSQPRTKPSLRIA
jgi:LysR family transcriptional regulator, benzoate and cis,cis-muconate-responsive activator of ben and cat genes